MGGVLATLGISFFVVVGVGGIAVESLKRYGTWDPTAAFDDWSSKVQVPAIPGSPTIKD